MFEGAGKEELGEDFWGGLDRDDLVRGCAAPGDSSLWLVFTAFMFVISWNLRRSKAVR